MAETMVGPTRTDLAKLEVKSNEIKNLARGICAAATESSSLEMYEDEESWVNASDNLEKASVKVIAMGQDLKNKAIQLKNIALQAYETVKAE